MEDDFDLQYADELDALDDFEPPNFSPCKPKRSLQFQTPNSKIADSDDALNTSNLIPLESPQGPQNGSLLSRSQGKSRRADKRHRSDDDFADLSGSDEERLTDLPSLRRQAKKAKTDISDLSPPPVSNAEQKIANLRKTSVRQSSRQQEARDITQGYDFERQRVHRRIPHGNFISTTGQDGDRVYIKVKDEDTLNRELEEVGKVQRSGHLLSVSMEELRDQVEHERQRQLMHEADRLTQDIHKSLEDRLSEDEENDDDISKSDRGLWVDKYAPKRYIDLLSDESINRTILHWLKLWDYVVFGKDVKVKKKENAKKEKDVKKKKFLPEVIDELDKHNRPVQKVVLLNGPPGLGKTTLAHIIASHCGYNVVEINASDDRSADVFKTKIEAATQMKSVLEADPRPNCLVIDEIDGAPQAAINVLISFIKRTDEPGKKKKRDEGILLRPIICICNDQYVPSLRVLRQNALVVNFPQTEPARLASRLLEVTRAQNFKADLNALMALCDKTDNDIRSCINTLQFCYKQNKELTVQAIQSMNVGQKDANKSLFSMWHEIFALPRPKKNKFISLHDIQGNDWKASNNMSVETRFKNVLDSAYCTGEYNKLIQGMFENYLESKFKDPNMEGLNFACDWLCFTDLVNNYIGHSQNYSFMKYIPYVTVTFHLLFASNQPQRIQYPHTEQDAVTSKQKNSNLVSALMSDMAPTVRKYNNETDIVLEVIAPLLNIIQPTLRPVNTQLYSAREKEEMAQLIQIMIAYNMTYNQEKTPEGQYIYTLDPNIEEVVRFSGMKQHKQLTYAAKQLIAREIGLERLRRNEAPVLRETEKKKEVSQRNDDPSFIPNHKQKLEAKPLTTAEEGVVEKDFFGRVIKKKTPEVKKEKKKEKKNVLNTAIWFHFTEGFSNAVRRNVHVQDFL